MENINKLPEKYELRQGKIILKSNRYFLGTVEEERIFIQLDTHSYDVLSCQLELLRDSRAREIPVSVNGIGDTLIRLGRENAQRESLLQELVLLSEV